MKKFIIIAAVLQLVSCKNLIKTDVDLLAEGSENIAFEEPTVNKNTKIVTKDDLLGYWVGGFESDMPVDTTSYSDNEMGESTDYDYYKKITFSIDNISKNTIKGHSIVSGNIQKFEGTLTETKNGFIIDANEPGNSKFDGKFSLNIKKRDTLMQGSWEVFKPEPKKITKRKLTLQKRLFVYDSKVQIQGYFQDWDKMKEVQVEYESEDSLGKPIKGFYADDQVYAATEEIREINASKTLLKKEVVENLTKADIFILRNSIFARHGYAFKDKKLRQFFDQEEWYMPVFADVTKDLTELERKNIDLLSRYETNAKEYYQHFGR